MTVQGFTDQGTLTQDNLFAGEFPRISAIATITGGIYTRGTLLGKISKSSEYTIATNSATDGSKIPSAVLGEDVDASTSTVDALIYMTGEFNLSALTIGTGLTLSSIADYCHNKSIFIKTNQGV